MTTSRNSLRAKAVFTFNHKGKRPAQEDYILADREKNIYVAADGFGGPLPGAIAAKGACEAVTKFLFKEAGDLEATLPFVLKNYYSLAGNVLFNSLIFANQRLLELNRGKNIHERGGASVLACFVEGDLLAVANAGDCHASLLRNGRVASLVLPKSYGRLCDPFAAESKEEIRAPLMALGMFQDLEPEVMEYRIHPGDWLLLHTDGISVRIQEYFSELQKTQTTADSAVKQLTHYLNKMSYSDNAAILLVIF